MQGLKPRSWIVLGLIFTLGISLYVHSRYVTEKRDFIRSTFINSTKIPYSFEYASIINIQTKLDNIDQQLDKVLFGIILEVVYMNCLFALLFVPFILKCKRKEEEYEEEKKAQEIEITQLQQICNGLVRKRIR